MQTPQTHHRQSSPNRLAGKKLAFAAGILLSLTLQAKAQSPLFTLTGGPTNVATQAAADFTASGGNWYQAAPAGAPVITSTEALISSVTGPFAYGNSSSTINASPASGGNKIILPGNKAVSSITVGNLNLASVSNPELTFNLILLGGNGNPVLNVEFTGSFGASAVALPVTATNAWTTVTVPVPANVQAASGPVSLVFSRTGNTSGANGAHFWAIDDVTISAGTPPVTILPCPVVAAGTYSWHGAGSGSGNTNAEFTNLANWCPQPVSVSALSSANLQLNLTETATVTLNANFTAASINATVAGNDNNFVLDLNGYSLNVTGNLSANVASGNANTDLEIRTGAGQLTVNGSTLIGNTPATGKAGFGAGASGGVLTFNGPVTLGESAGIFAPAPKTINVKSTLTNNSALLAANDFSGCTVNFNGTTAQSILGTQPLGLHNVVINNAAGVSSAAIDLLVPGMLTLANGLLTTGPQAMVKLGNTGSITEKADAYLVGYLKAENRTISAVPQTFGNIGATITTAAGQFGTSVTRVTSLYNFTIQHGNSQNYTEKQTIKRKYQISVANAPANLDASLTINYWYHELAGIPTEDLGFFRENQSAPGTWTSRGRDANSLKLPSVNEPGTIALSNIAAFSTWSVGGGSTPLPVELLWFTAKNSQNTGLLEWATATEAKNAGFQIEASNDNLIFETIGFIDVQSTRNYNTEYSFSEPQQTNRRGLRYYRLTQHDLDGTKTILGVRSVAFNATGATVTTSPNPFTYGFMAVIESDKEQAANVTLINVKGQVVARQDTRLTPGINQLDFSEHALANGTYVLRVQLENEIITTKVLKQ